jgi:hypothetical protein
MHVHRSSRAALLCLSLFACGDDGLQPTTAGSGPTTGTGTGEPGTGEPGTSSTTGAPTTGATGGPGPGTTTGGPEPGTTGGTSGPAPGTTTTASTGPEPGTTGGMPVDTSTDVGGFPVWVHFTDPAAHGGSDPEILDEVIRLIDSAPPGSTINAAIHSFTANIVQAALTAAHERGVIVKVAEDGSDEFDADESPKMMAALLGAGHVFCGDGKEGGAEGCVTTDASGIMHTKLYTFSDAVDPDGVPRKHVVWFGSANMTHATGAESFNNTVTIYGDTALYDQFNVYFGHLFAQSHYANNDYYDADAGRGYFVTPTARVYISPEQDTDLVNNRLNDIEPGADCEVRVMQAMMFDSRPLLIDRLVALAQGDCDVMVVGNDVQPESLAKLKQAKIPVRQSKVHDKSVIVHARFAGSPERRFLIFTGSHNWTQSANYRNDELFVRLESEPLHARYREHFQHAWDAGTPL